ncbi:hypothetical protein [Sphingomonas zeicaulis]|uniref:hypothetical protein n=1 Tax=Sphingomonas zeicaulis TaxID=1632740 RepID=UPI003D1EE38A
MILLFALLLAACGAADRAAAPEPTAAATATATTTAPSAAMRLVGAPRPTRPRDALRGDTPPEGSLPFEDPPWFCYAVPSDHSAFAIGNSLFRHESGYRTHGDGDDVHSFERYLKSMGLDLSITLMDWDDGTSLSVSAGDFRSFPGNVELEVVGGWLGVRKQRASRLTESVQVDVTEGQLGRRGNFLLIRIEDQQSRAYDCAKASLPGYPATGFADDAALVRFLTRHDTVIEVERCAAARAS